MNETEVKYFAGLFDADGSVSFYFRKHKDAYYASMVIQIASAHKDHLESLKSGSITACGKYWQMRICNKTEIESIAPRLVKHCVIKGAHLDRMVNKWREVRGNPLNEHDVDQLKAFIKESRKDAGPKKAKKHPTWAWVAGYLDGDGWFRNRYSESQNYRSMSVGAVAHPGDRAGLDLLQKAFGGTIRPHGQSHALVWSRNLGVQDSSFALSFLGKLVNHLRLKKYKVEQIIHIQRQRLSENPATAEATV